MKKEIMTLIALLCICTQFFYRCSNDPVTGIEVTNGTCTGKIYYTDNTVAVGAMVRLIPVDYDPSSGSDTTIDSTVTGSDGSYLFKVSATDFYNIIAEKGDVSCLQDSVSLLADGNNGFNNDTLEESGWLAGNVEVQPDNNPLAAIVLVSGTDRYTSPNDTLGNFSPLVLPAGSYTVKVFSTEPGYEPAVAPITIKPGDTTWLNTRIPTTYAPEISNFTVAYDSAIMTTTLHWSVDDTSPYQSFALHRYVNGDEDTILILDKNQTEYTDDCIFEFEKTVTYGLCAVGPTYKEGYQETSSPIYITGKAGSLSLTTITLAAFQRSFTRICIGSDGTRYLYDDSTIIKIDENGSAVKTLDNTDFGDNALIRSVACIDNGILYACISYSNQFIYKLDNELNILDSMLISDTLIGVHELQAQLDSLDRDSVRLSPDTTAYDAYRDLEDLIRTIRINFKIVFGQDGTIFLSPYCTDSINPTTTIIIYDNTFNYLNSVSLEGQIWVTHADEDTIITIRTKYPHLNVIDEASEIRIITIYDASFNPIAEYESIDMFALFGTYLRDLGRPATSVLPLSATRCLTYTSPGYYDVYEDGTISPKILIVADNKGTVIGRYNVPGNLAFSVTSSDTFYGYSKFSRSANTLSLYTFTPGVFQEN